MNAQEIELKINNQLMRSLDKSFLTKMFKDAGALIIDIIKERTSRNISIFGDKFGSYTAKYDKLKRKKFGANYKKPLIATGNMMKSLDYKVESVNKSGAVVTAKIRVFSNGGSAIDKQIEGLQSTTGTASNGQKYQKSSRAFLGLSVNPSLREEEMRQINKLISERLKANIKVQSKVK